MIYPGLPSNEVLAAVGKITLCHGWLEDGLKMAVKSLTGVTPAEARRETKKLRSSDLRREVRQLARKRLGEGEALKQLDVILRRAQQVTEKRNDLMHSLWARELDGDPVIQNRGDPSFGPIPTVQELEATADEIADVAKDLRDARLDGGFLQQALAAASA
jgi:hypothetical protein